MSKAQRRSTGSPLTVAILGFGHVARSLCSLLAQGPGPAGDDERPIQVVAAARRRGMLCAAGGLDHARLASGDDGIWRPWPRGWSGVEFAARVPADVLVELTTLDPTAGEPALTHCHAALSAGKHVVTANKGPIAFGYAALRRAAAAIGREVLFEATVMDGAPVFNLRRHCLRGCRVTGVRGILNSTTNMIVDEMAEGGTFAAALAKAQAMGIAEADPSLDVNGYDAAVKLCVLVNVLLERPLAPEEVARQGISDLTSADLQGALARGRRIKLIAEARDDGQGRFAASVQPVEVAAHDPYAQIRGTSSILTISTDLLGDLTITETAPGLRQTAYGVLQDLLTVARLEASKG